MGVLSEVDTLLSGVKETDDAVVADLDGNGSPDLASVGFYPEGSPSTVRSAVNIYFQDGNGGFGLATKIGMPLAASCLAAGDINGDGLTDLVVLSDNNAVVVLVQSSSSPGTFVLSQVLR